MLVKKNKKQIKSPLPTGQAGVGWRHYIFILFRINVNYQIKHLIMKSTSSPLWLAIISFICLIICNLTIVLAFDSKYPIVLFLGILIGIAGFVLAIVSIIKALKTWRFINKNPEIKQSKGKLIAAILISTAYLLEFIVLLLMLVFLFVGYSNGL